MPHKMITDRQKVDEALIAAIHRHRDSVLAELAERLAPFLPEGADLSGIAVVYDALPALIETEQTGLVEASRLVLAERTADRELRERRDDAKLVLRSTLIELWRAAVALLGEKRGEMLVKIDETPSVDPRRILEQGELTLAQLRKPGLEAPESILPGVPPLDIAAWAGRLEPEVAELRDALAGVVSDRQDIAALVALKNEARLDHDQVVIWVGRFLFGLFGLAERTEEAELVRRALRRRASRSDVEALRTGEPEESPDETETSEDREAPAPAGGPRAA